MSICQLEAHPGRGVVGIDGQGLFQCRDRLFQIFRTLEFTDVVALQLQRIDLWIRLSALGHSAQQVDPEFVYDRFGDFILNHENVIQGPIEGR